MSTNTSSICMYVAEADFKMVCITVYQAHFTWYLGFYTRCPRLNDRVITELLWSTVCPKYNTTLHVQKRYCQSCAWAWTAPCGTETVSQTSQVQRLMNLTIVVNGNGAIVCIFIQKPMMLFPRSRNFFIYADYPVVLHNYRLTAGWAIFYVTVPLAVHKLASI